MRVIAGKARSLPLKTIPGMDTRPTTDRIKETLFNMLQNHLYEASFLDLFAGSGAIGIEALSRGAKEAVFVENGKKAADCIQDNLTFTHLKDGAQVLNMDVLQALRSLEGKKTFDMIFMDPPYDHLWEKQVLECLADSHLADEGTLIIIEASLETSFAYLKELGFTVEKTKRYKTNQHVFVRKAQERNL